MTNDFNSIDAQTEIGHLAQVQSEECFIDDSRAEENCFPYNVTDLSDDADALASAGMGTDEDYGPGASEMDGGDW